MASLCFFVAACMPIGVHCCAGGIDQHVSGDKTDVEAPVRDQAQLPPLEEVLQFHVELETLSDLQIMHSQMSHQKARRRKKKTNQVEHVEKTTEKQTRSNLRTTRSFPYMTLSVAFSLSTMRCASSRSHCNTAYPQVRYGE
jgi:hypothetical protein